MKNSTKHLLISIVIMLTIVFISIPVAFAEINWIFPILTFFCISDVLYLVIAIIMCIATYKPNPQKKKKVEKKKIITYDYSYHSSNTNVEKNDTKEEQKPKKKFVYKTENDRLYEEAVKYFGKSYVKYRDKASVIEEYLDEEGSM